MSSFTVAQLAALVNLLECETGSHEQMIKSVFDAEKAATKRDQEQHDFWVAMKLTQRLFSQGLLEPQHIIATRPWNKCKYQGRPEEYQIRFWYKGYGHVNQGGDVSDYSRWREDRPSPYWSPEGCCLLAETYSEKEQNRRQDGDRGYPNHYSDFSILFQGYDWVRVTETHEFRDSTTEKIDLFTLKKIEGDPR